MCATGSCNKCKGIKSPKGEKGDSGTVITNIFNATTFISTSIPKYSNTLTGTVSSDIYNSGNGLTWNFLTLPTMASPNQMRLWLNVQVKGKNAAEVAIILYKNGSTLSIERRVTHGAPLGGSAYCFTEITYGVDLSSFATGDILSARIVSTDNSAAPDGPLLVEAYFVAEIIQ